MIPLSVVDAFTTEPFAGNPAGVCVLAPDAAPTDGWMRSVAAELRHSETAFASPRGGSDWALRWFTPETEVDLCGHATLATAHVLWTEGHADPAAGPLRFHTRSGVLVAEPDDGRIRLTFPALASTPVDPADEPDLAATVVDALGIATPALRALARNPHDLLVEVTDADTVRALAPDFAAVAAIETRGILVTAPGDQVGVDFVSRFFAPRVGIDEDPVTGSAHCALAPYWAPRVGRTELVGLQLSARGGTVGCTLGADDDGAPHVVLAGAAVTVSRGALLV